MLQKTFEIVSREQFNEVMERLEKKLERYSFKSVAAMFNSSRFEDEDVRGLLREFKKRLPQIKLAGISTLGLESDPSRKKLSLTVLFMEHTQVSVFTVENRGQGETEIAGEIREKLAGLADIRACAFLPSGFSMNYTQVLQEISEGKNAEIVFFGSIAHAFLRNTNTLVGMATDPTEAEGLCFAVADDAMIIDGIVLMAFGGEHLQVYARQILGWKPIGAQMEASGIYTGPKGERIVRYIDGKPAAQVYKKYLRVTPDQYFMDNVSELPLMIKRDGTLLARGPYMADKQGYLHFWADIAEGEKVQLSYANTAAILVNDQHEAEHVKAFEPQALLLTVCANRNIVLGEGRRQEVGLFKQVLPTAHYTYGGFEILRIGNYGGILNSVMVIIGMKETNSIDCNRCRLNSGADGHIELDLDPGGPIPVYLRLTNFMDAVTRDLKKMAEEAEAANKAKSAFLSNMSHEIRTPINAVLGMDEMILRESREKNVIKYAEDIRSAGNNLLGIVNDILDFSKI